MKIKLSKQERKIKDYVEKKKTKSIPNLKQEIRKITQSVREKNNLDKIDLEIAIKGSIQYDKNPKSSITHEQLIKELGFKN